MPFVNASHGSSGGGTGAFTAASTLSVTAGNTLLVMVHLQSSGNVVGGILSTYLSSIADNAAGGTNTYIPAIGTTNYFSQISQGGTSNFAGWSAYVTSIKTTATINVTATFASGATSCGFASVLLAQFSGLGAIDVAAINSQYFPATTTDAITSGTATVGVGDTAIGMTLDISSQGFVAGTGFAMNYTDATPASWGVESSTTISGTHAATFTAGATTATYVTQLLAFSGPGAAPDAYGSQIFRLQYNPWR